MMCHPPISLRFHPQNIFSSSKQLYFLRSPIKVILKTITAYCVCCFMCHCSALVVDMNRSAPAKVVPSNLCPFKPPKFPWNNAKLFGVGLQKKERFRRRLKFFVSAEFSKPSFSLNFGLDSQKTLWSHDVSQLPWIGPLPGDIAEVEAYCRIFRAAERLHTTLMDTLCNPITGECSVSYDYPQENKSLLEDKIVSVLGCMVSLLNKGREDVLTGRSSFMNSFRIVDMSEIEDNLPPLAIFRSEMKRCCESLHVALENYLTPNNDQNLNIWRKLQRLKNVCYDSGLPRGEDYPCPTLLANWNPIYLLDSKEDIRSKDSDVAFWSGSQVTEEGLKWLIERGFKTIVDLRAESVKDEFYREAIGEAIVSGKVELVEIPVEVGTAPSMEQVEKFAYLVSGCDKRLIYLHSKEGARRTSAMVSRWRQYMTRCASQFVKQSVARSGLVELEESSLTDALSEPRKGYDSLFEALDAIDTSNGAYCQKNSLDKEKKDHSLNGAHSGVASVQCPTSIETADNDLESLYRFCMESHPLKAQVPPCNVFSRKEMSKFFKTKRISPPTYLNLQRKHLEKLPVPRDMIIRTTQCGGVADSGVESRSVEGGNSNGSFSKGNLSREPHSLNCGKVKFLNGDNHVSTNPIINGFAENERSSDTETSVSTIGRDYFKSKAEKEDKQNNATTTLVSSDDELGPIDGDMCVSTTGVVRVQSRKKAEMFLVRTDGFSCAREKVTESSLAFTHPSTQQQMLMWKSKPKTVLLLKKLGKELMEEAKEVASFLYYQEKMNVLVEPDVHDIFARIPGFGFVQTFYSQDTSDLHERIDFVACLGGDGVILHASNLFRGAVPPVVSFNLGSLGFLTSHPFEDYQKDLRQVIHGNNTREGVYITLRMRLQCEIFRNGRAMHGKVFDVLNEVVVDRGSNPYLSKIECYEHDRLITKVQGDGVIVATPTGSTAYSTAAGGSMVHPNVPCMLFTPICPHSLSFRPVILPDSARLELKIPEDARSNAWVSLDGKRRQQLSRGDSVRLSMSQHPLPTVNKSDQTGDWFHSLIRCLNWNERLDQKAF